MFLMKTALVVSLISNTLVYGRLYEPRLDQLLRDMSTLKQAQSGIHSKLEGISSALKASEERRTWVTGVIKYIPAKSEGTLYSPELRDILPASSVRCTWEFLAPPGYQITLNFTYFNLQYMQARFSTDDSNVAYNKIKLLTRVADGEYATEKVFSEAPSPFTSHGNRLILMYEANSLFNGIGFAVHYSSKCEYQIEATEERRLFSHPLYGHQNYPNDVTCEWILTPRDKELVSFSLESFEVGFKNLDETDNETTDKALNEDLQESRCQDDYLEIYVLNEDSQHLLGRLCGDSGPDDLKQVVARRIRIVFHSDGEHSRAGFSAIYSQSDE